MLQVCGFLYPMAMIKKNKILFLGMLLFCLVAVWAHPYYVSITEINFNEKQQSLEISIKIFIDDFERMLETHGKKTLRIGEKNERKTANEVIEKYLRNHFKIEVKEQEIPFQFLGKEVEGAELYVFLEAENIPETQEITIKNTLLFETFDDQTNIINVTYTNGIQSERLVKNKPEAKFYFE